MTVLEFKGVSKSFGTGTARKDVLRHIDLRVQEGDPILRTVAINTAPGGQPVEYGTTWFAGDRITLTLREETEKQGDSDPILSQD